MHWLSELFHYIVCNIYKVIDRADSVSCQTSLHPFWRRSDLNILYNPCAVTRAELRILYCNFYIVGCFLIISLALYYRRAELLVKSSCCFSCNSKYTVTIYTVGCNLIFKYNVIQSQGFDRTLAYNSIFRENIDSVFRCFRIHFPCTSQFFDRTHHTAGFNSAEFTFLNFDSTRSFLSVMTACYTSAVKNNRNFISFFYVWSTCNDLYRFCSNIYLTDNQFICIRMFLDLVDLSDHDLVQICIQFLEAFHLCSCQCHGICIFLCCHIKIRHIHFNPR